MSYDQSMGNQNREVSLQGLAASPHGTAKWFFPKTLRFLARKYEDSYLSIQVPWSTKPWNDLVIMLNWMHVKSHRISQVTRDWQGSLSQLPVLVAQGLVEVASARGGKRLLHAEPAPDGSKGPSTGTAEPILIHKAHLSIPKKYCIWNFSPSSKQIHSVMHNCPNDSSRRSFIQKYSNLLYKQTVWKHRHGEKQLSSNYYN